MSNVLINGRSAVHAKSKGRLFTMDVCLTKIGKHTVPIPYMNVAESKDADKTASTVFINGQPVCHKDSVFSKSRGDEPGNKKGIKSRKKGAEASFIMGSANVLIEGKPAVRAMDLMTSNGGNTPPAPLMQQIGLPTLPSQVSPTKGPNAIPEALALEVMEKTHTQNGATLSMVGSDLTQPQGMHTRPLPRTH